MLNFLIGATFTIFSYLLILHAVRCKKAHSLWKNRGIETPTPRLLFFGNLLDLFWGDRKQLDRRWREEFGKVYGLYYGTQPHLVVGDPEIVQQICIKDFEVFVNNDALDISSTNRTLGYTVLVLKDDHWRRVRNIMSPTFTSGKIKRMFAALNECADDLIRQVEVEIGKDAIESTLNAKDLASLYTMDAICSCCYGLKLKKPVGVKSLKESCLRDDFIRDGLKAFQISLSGFIAQALFPSWFCQMLDLTPFPNKYTDPIAQKVECIIAKRRSLPLKERPNDYLQSLIDAQLDSQWEDADSCDSKAQYSQIPDFTHHDDEELHSIEWLEKVKAIKSEQGSPIKLTDQEMFSQAVLLILAGLETTGTLLCNAFYALAHHAQYQEELYQAVRAIYRKSRDFDFDYDTLIGCPKLDSFISEVNRIMPLTPDLTRVASRDYHVHKLKLTIPRGTVINIAAAQIMNDPDYWEEPEKFKPERFMPENRHKLIPCTYLSFGAGPRHCLGMRFALTEAKLAIAKLLINFKFEPAPNTSFPPEIAQKGPVFKLANPLVKITRRI